MFDVSNCRCSNYPKTAMTTAPLHDPTITHSFQGFYLPGSGPMGTAEERAQKRKEKRRDTKMWIQKQLINCIQKKDLNYYKTHLPLIDEAIYLLKITKQSGDDE